MTDTAPHPQRSYRGRSRSALAAMLLVVTVTLVVMAGFNFSQRARYAPVQDGVSWNVSPEGIQAALVFFGGPANRAGIRAGDILQSINGKPVDSLTDVIKHLFRAQAGTELRYELSRPGAGNTVRVVSVTVVPIPDVDPFSLRGFLEFVGVLYLAIGLFVLFRRWTASHALHFYAFCLTSFVVYSFSYSGKLDTFDWAVYWADSVALLLQPALFLHFALSFPEPHPWFRRRPWMFSLLYVSAAGLLLHHVSIGRASLAAPPTEFSGGIDRVEYAHVAVLFLLAAAVFEYTYRSTKEPTLVQQMKWVTRGTWMAILPFTAFYVLPLFLDRPPDDWMKLSTLSLIFIPLTFGYAVIRYRLMDVDLIFRRGVAYTLATGGVTAAYFLVAAGVAQLFHTNLIFGPGGVVVAILIAAALFPLLKDWTETWLERLFYRERYDYRQTLEEFARELASETDLDRLLAKLLDRLVATLPMHRLAIFLAEDDQPAQFRLVRGVGAFPSNLRMNFEAMVRTAGNTYVFTDLQQPIVGMDDAAQAQIRSLGLNYFIPCRVQNRIVGVLGLSKTLEGNLLNSEDIELTQTIAHHLAVALENARLYQDLEQKAEQVSQLKDFSESILESSTVGLVAVSNENRIDSWNSSMERLTGRPRDEVLNGRLDEVFPAALAAEVEARRQDVEISSLYKYELERPEGGPLLTNISITPLRSKDGEPVGKLLVFDDITERVRMEQQLLQTEKITSLGLLAAGVAHEVNTPLAVISNYAQMLAKQFEAGDERSGLVDKIVKQTFRASEIVSSLLNFSRTGTGTFEHSDLNRTLKETVGLLKHQLDGHGIEVVTELDEDLPLVSADAGRLQQVFLNLLLNARDAMPEGGRITIRSHARRNRALVEISDTGIGIPRDDLGKIFDPFFTTKAVGQGTGLGLAVSYGIIKEHNGTIRAESQPGRGTTFTLNLPALEAAPAKQRHANA